MQKSNQLKHPSHADIEVRAYEIWEKRGRPSNQEVECWLQAEQELLLLSVASRDHEARSRLHGVFRSRTETAEH
jgi:hypothetical protein